jgi:hypothetical protein
MILADEHCEFPNVGIRPRVLPLEEFVDFSLRVGPPDHCIFIRPFRGLCRLTGSIYPEFWSQQICEGKSTCIDTNVKERHTLLFHLLLQQLDFFVASCTIELPTKLREHNLGDLGESIRTLPDIDSSISSGLGEVISE